MTKRRRRWSPDKARILAATQEPGAIVAQIARAECVSLSLLYKWRLKAHTPVDTAPTARLATDELTVAANGVSHVLTTRRTSSDGVAEISLRFICSGVPIEVSHLRGPLLEDALRKVMGECKKAKTGI